MRNKNYDSSKSPKQLESYQDHQLNNRNLVVAHTKSRSNRRSGNHKNDTNVIETASTKAIVSNTKSRQNSIVSSSCTLMGIKSQKESNANDVVVSNSKSKQNESIVQFPLKEKKKGRRL